MAYTDAVGDVWKVTLGFSYPTGQVQEPGWHLRITATGGTDSRPALAGQVDALVQAHLIPHLDPLASYRGCKISPALTPFKYSPVITTPNTPGSSAGASLPTQVRVVTKLVTDFVGREFRGRVFGNTPTMLDQGTDMHPVQQLLDKWFTVLDTFRAGLILAGTNWKLVLFHRKIVGPPAVPASSTDVIKVVTQKKWGTQRKGGDFGRQNVSPPW